MPRMRNHLVWFELGTQVGVEVVVVVMAKGWWGMMDWVRESRKRAFWGVRRVSGVEREMWRGSRAPRGVERRVWILWLGLEFEGWMMVRRWVKWVNSVGFGYPRVC
jgi:hypothetical protein